MKAHASRVITAAGWSAALVTLAVAAIWLAVRIAPVQSVSAAGQTVQVGAAPLTPDWAGPGRLELFGQTIATVPQFAGPVRPSLRLAHITPGQEAAQLLQSGNRGRLTAVGERLAAGWLRYGLWETAVAAGLVVVVLVAVTGARRMPWRRALPVLAAGVVTVCAVNAAGFYLLASGTPDRLRAVHSLSDLVGRAPTAPVPRAAGPSLSGVRAVVLGDSTAAGAGNSPLPGSGLLDEACGRSADSFARQLAAVNGWDVLNLACSGATVQAGLLGAQPVGPQAAPAQLAEAQRAATATVVIVSIGANDIRWADLTRLCAAATDCDDRATTAFFQARLARFALDYQNLLTQLAGLPQHPRVLVNEYYDPFGTDTDCLAPEGLTGPKAQSLRSRLADLNTVLREGATAAGFTPVHPDFTGHALCSDQPFVQGPADHAPLHPNAGGEVAIALADQQALAATAPHPSANAVPATAPQPSANAVPATARQPIADPGHGRP